MRKIITAALLTLAALAAGLVPAAANATTVPHRIVWTVTGYSLTAPTHVVWTRKSFGTKPAADTYLTKVKALEQQACPLAPVSCATFIEHPAIVG